jgi:VWFA-related protein
MSTPHVSRLPVTSSPVERAPKGDRSRRRPDAVIHSAILIPLTLLAAWTIAAGVPARAQTPTFRRGANYVRVDVYPTDRNGIVADLRQDEVELLEDGVPQKIEQFELVRIPPGGPEAARVEPNSIRASRQAAADPRARVFVIFFDTLNVDDQTPDRVRTPLREFLDEALGPDDLVAVMAPGMSASNLAFTRRTTILDALLNETGFASWKVQSWNNLDPTEEHYQKCYPTGQTALEMMVRRREQLTFAALEDLVTGLGELREERKTVMVITSGWLLFNQNQTLVERHPPLPPNIGDRLRGGRGSTGTDLVTSIEQDDCARDLMALSAVDNSNRIRRLAEMANRQNVSFYPIDPIVSTSPCLQGSSVLHGLPLQEQLRAAYGSMTGCNGSTATLPRTTTFQNVTHLQQESSLRALAEDTDGVAIVNTANVAAPMRRIIADTSAYYLLGYQSTNGALDGRYRKISVRVKRPGIDVRARRGYQALSAAEMRTAARPAPAPARAPDAVARALTRLNSMSARAPVMLRTAVWTREGSGIDPGGIWIVGELGSELRAAAAWRTGARARVLLTMDSGAAIGPLTGELSGTPPVFMIRVPETTPLTPGAYSVRVTLSNSATGDTVSDSAPLAVAMTPAALGEPLVFRRGVAASAQPSPTADAQFRRSERLHVELPTSSSEDVAGRLLDSLGKPLAIPVTTSRRRDGKGAFDWVLSDVALSPFAPGDYVLELTQGGTSQVLAFKVIN